MALLLFSHQMPLPASALKDSVSIGDSPDVSCKQVPSEGSCLRLDRRTLGGTCRKGLYVPLGICLFVSRTRTHIYIADLPCCYRSRASWADSAWPCASSDPCAFTDLLGPLASCILQAHGVHATHILQPVLHTLCRSKAKLLKPKSFRRKSRLT